MPKDITIGADPEFGLIRCSSEASISDGSLHCAEDIINDQEGEFGVDGAGDVAEIRPKPSFDPLAVVGEIRRILQFGAKAYPQTTTYAWKAGDIAEESPIGGHIHFGTNGLPGKRMQCTRALDAYLAQSVILIEDPQEARNRRMDSGYGSLGDCRSQPWGFEYRVIGSWITSPYVAASVLCLAKAIVHEVYRHNLVVSRTLVPHAADYAEAAFKKIRPKFEAAWADIVKFDLYRAYKPHIDFLRELVVNNLSWFPRCGLRSAWGIVDGGIKRTIKQKKVTLESIWCSLDSLKDDRTRERIREGRETLLEAVR